MNGRRNRGNQSSQSNQSSQKRGLSKSFFTLTVLSLAALVGLGFFRFSAAQLEYRLSSMEQSIERYSAEEVELQQSLSSLISPIKIYSYCKDRLGMYAARQEVVNLPQFLASDTAAPEPQKGWRAGMLAFFGLTMN